VAFSREDRAAMFRFWLIYVLIAVGTWSPQIAFYISGARSTYTYFSVADRLANTITFFSIISNFYLAPLASASVASKGALELREAFSRVTVVTALASLPVALVLIVVPGFALELFRSNHDTAAQFVAIMGGAQFFNVLTGSANTILLLTGFEAKLTRSLAIAVAAQVVALLTLPYAVGSLGYALSYATYIILQNGLAAYHLKRCMGFGVLDAFADAWRKSKTFIGRDAT
jgi:O-antigen/teichoic acid export membrane protein